MLETNKIESQQDHGALYDFIISNRNIYRAIYALESYIDEPYLLSDEDLKLYYKLSDKFNWKLIDKRIGECQVRLKNIMDKPKDLFDVRVYFRLKKFEGKLKYRPLHTAGLTDLICMVAILQVLMFEDSDEAEELYTTSAEVKQKGIEQEANRKGRNLSDLSKSIPDNFYGNKPSDSVNRIFQKWQTNYQKYNQLIVESSRQFRKSHKYNYEVSLDIKNFFPSISPFYIHAKICHELCNRYTSKADRLTLRIAVAKLLFLNVTTKSVDNEKFGYYDDYDILKENEKSWPKGWHKVCLNLIFSAISA